MEGVHIRFCPNHNRLQVAEIKQIGENLAEIILRGYVERSLLLVVLKGHQGGGILRLILDKGLEGVDVIGSDGGEERLVGYESQGLGVHVLPL